MTRIERFPEFVFGSGPTMYRATMVRRNVPCHFIPFLMFVFEISSLLYECYCTERQLLDWIQTVDTLHFSNNIVNAQIPLFEEEALLFGTDGRCHVDLK